MERIRSFFIALGVNMAFRYKYLFLIILCLILHFACGLSLWFSAGALLAWILHGVIVTLMITFVANCNNVPRNQKGISLHPGRTQEFDRLYRGKPGSGTKQDENGIS